jgi:hypothetical protein
MKTQEAQNFVMHSHLSLRVRFSSKKKIFLLPLTSDYFESTRIVSPSSCQKLDVPSASKVVLELIIDS